MFTRRDILKAFLGLPLALTACKTESRVTDIDGRIVGASDDIGHILRDRRRFEVPPANKSSVGTAIVGGGIAGLSAGWRFVKEGYDDFRLLELESRAGGTSVSGESKLTGYPWGAHYLPLPFKENRDLASLLAEMGVVKPGVGDADLRVPEQFLTRDPEERIFYKGRWYEGLYLYPGASDDDLRELRAFQKELDFWIDWRDERGRRAFTVPVAECSTDERATSLDKITFAEWLRQKGFRSERLLWYCNYATRDDYGLTLDRTSAWAGLFYFCSRVPSAGKESQPFITFPEGNGRFVAHFLSKIGSRVRGSSLVVELVPSDDGVRVVYMDTRTRELHELEAKRVIFSAPLFTADYLIRGFRREAPFDPREFRHNAWFVANLFLRERPRNRFRKDFPLAWDNVLYESPSLGYVVATHQKGIDYGPTILTYYYPMTGNDPGESRKKLLSLDWKELADICLSDLSRAHPNIRSVTEKIDIMRWGHAMISPVEKFIWAGERQKAMKELRNIHFAHSDLSGIAIFEEAFYHGQRAAREVLARVRKG